MKYIRWMIRRDMPEVLDIESACFSSPWSEDDFIRRLRQRNVIGMVLEVDERVHAFMLYELQRGRLELVNLAVGPLHQRGGLGTMLIEKLKSKLSENIGRRQTILVDVAERNLSFQLFLRSLGFRCVDIEHNPGGDDFRFVFEL